MLKKGLFIAFEGIDGCGKTTQMEMVFDYLSKQEMEPILTREPGGTKISEKIRRILLDTQNSKMDSKTEMFLYAASRAQLVYEKLLPAVNEGKVVICDRFIYSSIVYQGYARGLGMDNVRMINDFALNGFYPDITFYLNIPIEVSISRMKEKNLDRIEKEGISFKNKIRAGYAKLLEEDKNRIIEIDAQGKKEEVFSRIKIHIDEIIKRRRFK